MHSTLNNREQSVCVIIIPPSFFCDYSLFVSSDECIFVMNAAKSSYTFSAENTTSVFLVYCFSAIFSCEFFPSTGRRYSRQLCLTRPYYVCVSISRNYGKISALKVSPTHNMLFCRRINEGIHKGICLSERKNERLSLFT